MQYALRKMVIPMIKSISVNVLMYKVSLFLNQRANEHGDIILVKTFQPTNTILILKRTLHHYIGHNISKYNSGLNKIL